MHPLGEVASGDIVTCLTDLVRIPSPSHSHKVTQTSAWLSSSYKTCDDAQQRAGAPTLLYLSKAWKICQPQSL